MIVTLALILTISGCAVVYLASPNQKWLGRALPGKPALVAGGLLLAGGVATWIATWRPFSGVLIALHVVMACLLAFPYIAALRGVWRDR